MRCKTILIVIFGLMIFNLISFGSALAQPQSQMEVFASTDYSLPVESEEFTSAARYATITLDFDRTDKIAIPGTYDTEIKPYNYDCNSWSEMVFASNWATNGEYHIAYPTEDCGSAGDQTMGIDITISSEKGHFVNMEPGFTYSSSMPEKE
ncbi:MAG: hypothetical protein GF307_02410 [candidate division Zixibacteria bacterium]|nr:hypothetical protein [candidate division Zixibacteria bacterium]